MNHANLQKEVQNLYRDKWRESESLEFKAAQEKIPSDLWPTYSAFANTRGGIIIFGVADNGEILGIRNIHARQKELVDALNNPEKCSINLCQGEQSIVVVALNGKEVLALKVPKAQPENRPVYLNGNDRNSYKRSFEADQKCSRQEVEWMLRDKGVILDMSYSPDLCIVKNSTLNDLDKTTIRQFRNRVQTASPDNPWLGESDEVFLRKLQCYRKDRNSGEEGVTMAALLMFGTSESLNELIPSFQLDYFEYDGTEENDINRRWSDRITTDGSWAGNLFQFFFKVLPRLKDGFRQPFRLNADLMRQGESPAQIAVREALANALIHADYQREGSIKITKYTDGLVLSNPGTLLMSREKLFDVHDSRCRNKTLQRLFQMMGVVDKAGSGVDKIVKGLLEQCLSFPQVKEENDPVRVEWKLPYVSLLSKEKLNRVTALIGERAFQQLSCLEKLILAFIPEEEYVGNKEIRQYIPIHPVDMTKCLSHLTALDYLSSRGRSNATKYKLHNSLCKKGMPKTSSVSKDEDSVPKGQDSVPKGQDSVPKGQDSVPKGQDSVPKVSGALEKLVAELKLTCTQMELLLGYQKCKRNPPEITDQVILAVCSGKWVTLAQLSILLDRNPQSIRRNAIQSLLRHGRLRRRFEDPNHNAQAYTSADGEGIS